jgi:hypothetical protein
LGLGVDDLRWLAPVRPGDVIHIEGEVVELKPSKTKPQGVVRVKWTGFNQYGDPIYTFTPIAVVCRVARADQPHFRYVATGGSACPFWGQKRVSPVRQVAAAHVR